MQTLDSQQAAASGFIGTGKIHIHDKWKADVYVYVHIRPSYFAIHTAYNGPCVEVFADDSSLQVHSLSVTGIISGCILVYAPCI